jgi:hypothetical protein
MTKILPVHLRDDQHKALKQYDVDTGQPMNESVRQGVDLFLDKIIKKVKKKGEL